MGLIATISDPAWRGWAHALPTIDRRNPEAFATYLFTLERVLEDAPLSDSGLSADDLRSLLPLLNSHRQTIAMEMLRLTRRARESTVPGAAGGLVSALWAAGAPLIAAGQFVLALFGLRAESRQARLETLADRIDSMITHLEMRLK